MEKLAQASWRKEACTVVCWVGVGYRPSWVGTTSLPELEQPGERQSWTPCFPQADTRILGLSLLLTLTEAGWGGSPQEGPEEALPPSLVSSTLSLCFSPSPLPLLPDYRRILFPSLPSPSLHVLRGSTTGHCVFA